MVECSLCHSINLLHINGPDKRIYYGCNNCSLIFADSRHYLSADQEKERYLKHCNSLKDENYLNFLRRAVNPALPYLNENMTGLDYGCGPVSAIQYILMDYKISCNSYDPIFLPNKLQPPYDFIFSTEVFEHFFKPGAEMKRLDSMLKTKSYIIIMTEFYKSQDYFKDWYYPRDPSHVCFYSLETIEYICKILNYKFIYTDNSRVVILRKN